MKICIYFKIVSIKSLLYRCNILILYIQTNIYKFINTYAYLLFYDFLNNIKFNKNIIIRRKKIKALYTLTFLYLLI